MMIKQELVKILNQAGVKNPDLTTPPNSEMGDFAFACFDLAKEKGKNPVEVAGELEKKLHFLTEGKQIENCKLKIFDEVKSVGPYVNFYLNSQELARIVLNEICDENFCQNNLGKGKKVMVEFAHPNTHKAFHIGHLRTLITGETVVRVLQNVGYKVVRANYQGDVGMQIAKCLWGLQQSEDEYKDIKNKSIKEKVEFLGKVYAKGAQAFEKDKKIEVEVREVNKKIYTQDKSIIDLYKTTRQWSLDYFDQIYKRLNSHFDRFYFESEVFERGKEIVLEFLKKGVFKKSKGAIIFEGSKHELHDRVFVNSQDFPTYEGKDMALAELQFSEHNPDKIIHVVGKEQIGYFQVVFKALESTLPISKDKEHHLVYGWVSLKGGKMSSRTGKVVLGEWLLDEVEKKVQEIMKNSDLSDKEKKEAVRKISMAAVKYTFLKTGVKNDIKFDLEESVNLTGDSGPYLLYIVARIRSIIKKTKEAAPKSSPLEGGRGVLVKQRENNTPLTPLKGGPTVISYEKQLLLELANFSEVTEQAAVALDPSKIARYLFVLAQSFNSFYDKCPVLKAEEEVKEFRLQLIKAVEQVMSRGLDLLGIETVEKM
ncbi:MAG: arginine--tRNA ligase [Parcubacteria group bacterium]|nr:arginine--tRNA ligase [Parcubacteria group bacterium]